jgi:hypothetical protein
LRGAGVQIDGRKVARVLIVLVLAAMAVLAVLFTIAGVQKNSQADRLHHDGVPVTVTVTGCLGLLGGSGSNAAGYSCKGTYTLHGHTYTEPLPGSTFHRPGAVLPAVAVPGDPALVSPVSIEQDQRSSAGVFVLPAVFLGLFLVGTALFAGYELRRRRDQVGGV